MLSYRLWHIGVPSNGVAWPTPVFLCSFLYLLFGLHEFCGYLINITLSTSPCVHLDERLGYAKVFGFFL